MKKIFNVCPQFVLATLSQTRIDMFRETGIPFSVEPHDVDEEKIKKTKFCEQKERLATSLAEAKARSVEKKHPNKIIIGSDQILICEDKLLSKPVNLKEAERNLLFLAGRHHYLWSSVVVLNSGSIKLSVQKKAYVYFKNISKKEIRSYIYSNKNTVLSSVGCYKIEENEKYGYIKILFGDEETIKGFPIQKLLKKIKSEKCFTL